MKHHAIQASTMEFEELPELPGISFPKMGVSPIFKDIHRLDSCRTKRPLASRIPCVGWFIHVHKSPWPMLVLEPFFFSLIPFCWFKISEINLESFRCPQSQKQQLEIHRL